MAFRRKPQVFDPNKVYIDHSQEVLEKIHQGIPFKHLKTQRTTIKRFLRTFQEHSQSTSLFISGPPGSGKTFTLNNCFKKVQNPNAWTVTIDCRLFDTDKLACKEFFRQLNKPASSDVLDVLRQSGCGFIIFDHFDCLKIIKRQFFLYTLFDSIHTQSIELAVILIASTYDPLTNLEKRVKSRFTPVVVDIPLKSAPFDFGEFLPLLKTGDKDWDDSMCRLSLSSIMQPLYRLNPSFHIVNLFFDKVFYGKGAYWINDSLLHKIADDLIYQMSPKANLESLSQLELFVLFGGLHMVQIKGREAISCDELLHHLTEDKQIHCKIEPSLLRVAYGKLEQMKLFQSRGDGKDIVTVFSDDLEPLLPKLTTSNQLWAKRWIDN